MAEKDQKKEMVSGSCYVHIKQTRRGGRGPLLVYSKVNGSGYVVEKGGDGYPYHR